MSRATRPRSVNLKALESRLRRICWRRFESVRNAFGSFGSSVIARSSAFDSATGRNVRSRYSSRSAKVRSPTSTVTVPDSILARSRMSLMSFRRSFPEETLRAGVRLNRVQHDADRLHELVEEHLVGRAEAVEGGELHDRLHTSLEEDGQHDDVERGRLAQARGDLDVVRRHAGEDDLLLLERRLADEAFVRLVEGGEVLAAAVGVAGEEL